MPGDVSADTHEVKAYAAAMHKAPQVLKRETITAVNRSTTEGEGRSKRYIQTDTHAAQRSLTMVAAREMGGSIRGAWGTNIPYGRVLNDGRSPGSAMPPSGVLLGWMGRHGIDPRMEFVIRRAIGRHGFKGSKFMDRARAEVRPLLRRELQAAVKRTLATIK
jgi:hypothetical protein